MSDMERSKYSAAPALVGYVYQCRLALLMALRRVKTDPCLNLSIETLDDVVFEKEGIPVEIIQTKHHMSRKANLTDGSADLWKTIRIWCDLYRGGLTQARPVLCMMTTANAPEGSAAYYLRAENRNVVMAERLLLQTAQTSVSQTNKDAYAVFLELSPESRQELLGSVIILDQGPLIEDIDRLSREALWSACHRSKIEQFLVYLEGWWFKRILKHLLSDKPIPILGEELDSQLNELCEQFKSDALPIYEDLKTATVDSQLYQDYIFVHQLKLIDIGSKRMASAINNYYRAFEQRSRWVREELLLVGDLEYYEQRLIEEWEIHFETMRENLGEDAVDSEKIKAGRIIYDWVEKEADIPIRPRCNEPFITRGSYHMLADKREVGWHVEFRSRLVELLEGRGALK